MEASTWATLRHGRVACTRCERKGRYQLAELVHTLGADFPMRDLGAKLADCPNRRESIHRMRCDVYFPGLLKIMSTISREY